MSIFVCRERERVLEADSHVLVTGGPGSGKTTIALAKAKSRIEDGLLAGQSVLFLSFSRAAVGRVIEASQTEVPKELRSCLSIQTFHSFFWEVLRAYGYLLGAPKAFRLLLPHDEASLREGGKIKDPEWALECERLFREEGLVAFDLFAQKTQQLLARSERLRDLFSSRHPLIVVDEAQDTAEDQWGCVKLFASRAQLICLADLDQQIFDFRPGVSSERLEHIMDALNPLRIDLTSENHRSPNCEIVKFGNDILLNTPRGAAYKGVSRKQFRPNREKRDAAIRSSVGMVNAKVKECIGSAPESIAILGTWGRGITIITRALTGNGETDLIPHRVMFDEASVFLASRLVAFLLEPKRSGSEEFLDLAEGLELGAAAFRSKGSSSSLAQAQRMTIQASQAMQGQSPRTNGIGHKLLEVLRGFRTHSFSGEPKRDWIEARRRLATGCGPWVDLASDAEQLIAFQRGKRISEGLSEVWQENGCYIGARVVLDTSLSQDQLLSGASDLRGIHVMTVHKSKGKEFDAVVILDDSNNSPLIFCRELAPYSRSRRLLRVGITRARHHVLMLTDQFSPSTLLAGHWL